jgi:hypothetical protein
MHPQLDAHASSETSSKNTRFLVIPAGANIANKKATKKVTAKPIETRISVGVWFGTFTNFLFD